MIEKISLNNIATYDEEGVELEGLKEINFIYGANGSGKTTLSNYLADNGRQGYEQCFMEWKNATLVRTLVYNKEFREENLREKIKGVFTLGKATQEDLDKIEEKVVSRDEIKETILKQRETRSKLETEFSEVNEQFKDSLWQEGYKKFEFFKDAFRGFLTREGFKSELLIQTENNTAEIYSLEELKSKYGTIYEQKIQELPEISKLEFNSLLQNLVTVNWSKKIVGKGDVDIGKLIQRLNIDDWVNEGKSILEDDNEVCPFCQQNTITQEFRSKLESYFDEDFTASLQDIRNRQNEFERQSQLILGGYEAILEGEKQKENTKLDKEQFLSHLRTLTSQVTTNKERINSKIKEPSRSIEMINLAPEIEVIDGLIELANTRIVEHNKIVENIQSERHLLNRSIWKLVSSELKPKIDDFSKKLNGLRRGIDAVQLQLNSKKLEWKNLDGEIRELSKNITSVQPAIDEINRTLESLNFLNFRIEPITDTSQYRIVRHDGSAAQETLSEGEITFITFLYFLQISKGGFSEDSVNDERVLVIDDPISSLDSNILFIVSTLIKQVIKDIRANSGNVKQIIILTHNVYFHKEASFIDGRTKQIGNTHYWILRKNQNRTVVQAHGQENPISTSYELLWRELRDKEHNSGITIQNVMRRIIENYFRILGKYRDDHLVNHFNSPQEKDICRSLISWINEGSHSITDDLFIEVQDDLIDKYYEVFERIFEVTNHHEHYKMMMEVISEGEIATTS